jgi:transposase
LTDVEAQTFTPLIKKRVKRSSVVCSETWRGSTGIATGGYVFCVVEHIKREYTDDCGNYINGLEGFWRYLKRILVSKSGVRKERLPLYLADCVWRYSHRKFSIRKQQDSLLNILYLY